VTLRIPEQIYEGVRGICIFSPQKAARCSETRLDGAKFEALPVMCPKMSVLLCMTLFRWASSSWRLYLDCETLQVKVLLHFETFETTCPMTDLRTLDLSLLTVCVFTVVYLHKFCRRSCAVRNVYSITGM